MTCPDSRAALRLRDVQDTRLRSVAAPPTGAPRLVLEHVQRLSIKDCRPLKDREVKAVELKSY